jgi:8-oxo-dGTP diphosphatase
MEIPECFYRVSVKALIFNETRDKFLICEEENGMWDLPGGGLDFGMTPQEDLPREIMEEMGLNVTWMAENPAYFFTGESLVRVGTKVAVVIYETTVEHLDFTASDECVAIRYINKDDITGLKLFDGAGKLAGVFKPENH